MTIKQKWHVSSILRQVNDSPVLLWKVCENTDFSWLTFYSVLPTSTQELTVKTFPALCCNCTKDHSFTSVHNKPPTLVLNMLLSQILKFKQPLTKHSQPFHTNTAAGAIEAFPAGRQLRHETGFGDVQCSRQCYSICNGTNALNSLMQREKHNNGERQRSMKLFVWKNVLILLTRKWVFLSGMWKYVALSKWPCLCLRCSVHFMGLKQINLELFNFVSSFEKRNCASSWGPFWVEDPLKY